MRVMRHCKRTPDDPAPEHTLPVAGLGRCDSGEWTILTILGAVCGENRSHGSEGGEVPRGTDLSHFLPNGTADRPLFVRRQNKGGGAWTGSVSGVTSPLSPVRS